MEWLLENWDRIGLLLVVFGFMFTWRRDTLEEHKQMLEAMRGIITQQKDLREQISKEHEGLSTRMERLDTKTAHDHLELTKALTGLTTSLEHLIDEERAARNK